MNIYSAAITEFDKRETILDFEVILNHYVIVYIYITATSIYLFNHCLLYFLQFMFNDLSGSVSLAWVGDGTGVSVVNIGTGLGQKWLVL